MSEVLDEITFTALEVFDASLKAANASPDERMKLAMMYIHKLVNTESYGIRRRDFMSYAGAVVRKFDELEMRRCDFERRETDIVAKGHHPRGKPKQ